jgi:iron complex transport system substrate-binding protein
MKLKSKTSTAHEMDADRREGHAAGFCAGSTRVLGLVGQALLPVRGLPVPGKKRTGKSACATCAVLVLFSVGIATAQTRAGQTEPPAGDLTSASITPHRLKPMLLTDEAGRHVAIPADVRRVVSLAPNLTEIVYALGRGDQLAGDTDFCDYPPAATRKPHVGGPINPNFEQIVALMPDLVLATEAINRRETVDALDRLRLPVYVTDPHSVDGMVASVEHIGAALHAEDSAEALVSGLRERLSSLDQKLAGATPRRVLFVVWPDPLISVGRDTFISDALRRAGAQSVVDTSAEWPRVNLEEIIRLQPEFLVFASAHAGDTQHDIEALRTRPGWRDLDALRDGKIAVISDAINRPAPRLVDAIEQLARALHPELLASRDNAPAHPIPVTEEACACAH